MAKTERLEIKETLVFYDFPRLFVGKTGSRSGYLCWFIDDEPGERFRFLCVPVREKEVEALKDGARTVYSVFLERGLHGFFIAEWKTDGILMDRSRPWLLSSISFEWLPGKEYYCCSLEKEKAAKKLKISKLQGDPRIAGVYKFEANKPMKTFWEKKYVTTITTNSLGRKFDLALA